MVKFSICPVKWRNLGRMLETRSTSDSVATYLFKAASSRCQSNFSIHCACSVSRVSRDMPADDPRPSYSSLLGSLVSLTSASIRGASAERLMKKGCTSYGLARLTAEPWIEPVKAAKATNLMMRELEKIMIIQNLHTGIELMSKELVNLEPAVRSHYMCIPATLVNITFETSSSYLHNR